MNAAEILVYLIEKDGNQFIFGHPGEQILPFYRALKESSLQHVLTRHEQGASHAADAYARSSGEYGICISTAGPGAMNLVMGVSTAFKDSVPMLVITGDNDYSQKGSDTFQSFPINSVFENISIKSFHPADARSAILNMLEALVILHKFPRGPVHINLSKDVLLEEIDIDSLDLSDIVFFDIDLSGAGLNSLNSKGLFASDGKVAGTTIFDDDFLENLYASFVFFNEDDFNDFSQNISSDVCSNIKLAIERLEVSQKPLLIIGNGILWSKSIVKLNDFLSKTMLPVTTTYHSRGIVSEYDDLNLGMVGLRGNSLSNYAYDNADCILVLGAKLSERTIASSDFDVAQEKIIHVNIDKNCLKGSINVCADVSYFLDCLLLECESNGGLLSSSKDWLDEVYSNYEAQMIDGIADAEENYNPLRPPYAINRIISSFEGAYFVSDAGTHTTWTTLLVRSDSFGKLLFSGGFGPMGYALAGAIGVAFSLKGNGRDDKVVVICGDGDIQMVIQELATLREYDLNISVFVINNSQLGIIRQWEETVYGFDRYEVDLNNPDFAKLANAYGIDSASVNSKDELDIAIADALASDGPFLADVHILEENIPMPKK